ncbi:MAG TPA: EamA family transporter [Bryobacteraceae bacterium]|nr:EamA family transporter [Bryobacteraceae bacterium]
MQVLESGIFIAIVAHFLIGASLVWDKVLLGETEKQSVVNYVFWLGAISIFGCIVGAFGMKMPSVGMLLISLAAGICDLVATYFYYKALKSGEASQTLAIMGGFAPLATALIGIRLLHTQLEGMSIWGFALMVIGGFFMFFSERINVRKILPLVVMSSGFFGISNVFQKMAFDTLGFTTGFVFFSIGIFLCALMLLLRKKWRDEIFTSSKDTQPKSKVGYFSNRLVSGVGSFLVAFAISRAHPDLVSAISGVRYATIFIGVYLLTKFKPQVLKEAFSGWTLTAKSIATALIIAGLAVTGLGGNGSAASATAFLFKFGNILQYGVSNRWRNVSGIILDQTAGL